MPEFASLDSFVNLVYVEDMGYAWAWRSPGLVCCAHFVYIVGWDRACGKSVLSASHANNCMYALSFRTVISRRFVLVWMSRWQDFILGGGCLGGKFWNYLWFRYSAPWARGASVRWTVWIQTAKRCVSVGRFYFVARIFWVVGSVAVASRLD